jgi:hypothetical protein
MIRLCEIRLKHFLIPDVTNDFARVTSHDGIVRNVCGDHCACRNNGTFTDSDLR